ncbi:hypothetical protein HYPSUDRAFT_84221 [Hypholoma sublateritium FD-334 SS-4]|uniref:Uncharacterized protein n=1 Tax=Hypholoma sublateritium (strain FD-334 SS-4) TaxID=945553 RepID=A0A0D2P771_HYPSF|nr:hypothetical protein HYPSUDRAFT_84221 [Hypholoma sublateritium FD-334 SS-4]
MFRLHVLYDWFILLPISNAWMIHDLPTWSPLPNMEIISKSGLDSDTDSEVDELASDVDKSPRRFSGKHYNGSSQTSNSSPSRGKRQSKSTANYRASAVRQPVNSDARAAVLQSYEAHLTRTGTTSAYPCAPTADRADRPFPSPAKHTSQPAKELAKAPSEDGARTGTSISSVTPVAQEKALNVHITEQPVPSHAPPHIVQVVVQPAPRAPTSRFPRRAAFPTLRESSVPYIHTSPTSVSASAPREPRRLRERHAQLQWVPPQSATRRAVADIPAREVDQNELEVLTEASIAPVLFKKKFLRQPNEDRAEAAMRMNSRHLLARQRGQDSQSAIGQTQTSSSSRAGRAMAVPSMTRSRRRDLIIESIFGTEEGFTSASEA